MGKWFTLDTASKLLAVLSLFIAILAAWKALPLDAELKALQAETQRLDNELKLAEVKMREAESGRKLTFELYKEVKTLLENSQRTAREEEVLRVLIETMAEDPLRYKLLSVLAVSAENSSTKTAAVESSKFYEAEAALATRQTTVLEGRSGHAAAERSLTNYDIDIFYCAARSELTEPIARKVAELKLGAETGRWRVRALPETINQQAGYQVQTNEIRYNLPSEETQANILQERLAAKGITTTLRPSMQQTPWYLSIFICA